MGTVVPCDTERSRGRAKTENKLVVHGQIGGVRKTVLLRVSTVCVSVSVCVFSTVLSEACRLPASNLSSSIY